MPGSRMLRGARPYTVGPYRPDLDAGVLRALQTSFPNGWGGAAPWRWKQPDRPGFRPEDCWVAVAAQAAGGDAASPDAAGAAEVIGCYSTTAFPVQLGGGVTVMFSYDGDLAVTPAAWGRAVPAAIRDASERRLFDPRAPHRVALRGGFTTPKLNERVYAPLYGLTFVPETTTEYRKALGLTPLRRHVDAVGTRALARGRVAAALARRPLVVDLRVAGLDDAHVVLAADGFRLERGHAPDAHLRVGFPARVVAASRAGARPLALALARELFRGHVRVRGLARQAPTLARLAAALVRRG